MDRDDSTLRALAEAIADRGAPDWRAAEQAVASDRDRALVGRLRTIEAIVRVHEPVVANGDSADPPFTWGPLRVDELIGHGRFGDVYRAWDPVLHRTVALKLLRHVESDALADDVIEEGRLAARVRHPNVITIYGAQRIDGRTGIWMELVHGRTLESELAERGPFDATSLTRIAVELCGALAAVHHAGLVHRDVKATNVMRDASGRSMLGDFGTGRDLDENAANREGLAGTPAYLAPEIFSGQPATPQSDLYSLGVLLYRLATGQFPTAGTTVGDLRQAHARGAKPSIRSHRTSLPSVLQHVIDRALDPDPARRFQTAAEMEGALLPPRRQWIAAAAIVATAAIVAAGIFAVRDREERPAPAGITTIHLDPDFQERVVFRGPAHGTLIPCTPRGTVHVAICNLADKSTRVLQSSVPTEYAPVQRMMISPDGQRIAYTWILIGSDRTETDTIRIMDLDGSSNRELYRGEPGSPVLTSKWTAAGEALLVREMRERRPFRELLIRLKDGVTTELWRWPPAVVTGDVTQDLEMVVVSTRTAAGDHDLIGIDRQSGTARWRLEGPTDDTNPTWAPDGRTVTFVSLRHGTENIMTIDAANTGTPGPPLVVTSLGRMRVTSLSFGSDGSLFLMVLPPSRTAYMVDVDLDRLETGSPQPLDSRAVEDTVGADWHGDGRIAYLRSRIGHPSPASTIIIAAADGTAERELKLPRELLLTGSVARWSPDGRLVVLHKEGRQVLDVIDPVAGSTLRIANGLDIGAGIRNPRWNTAGDAIYFFQSVPAGATGFRNVIRRHDLRTSQTELVYQPNDGQLLPGTFDVTRDGQLLLALRRRDTKNCVIRVVRPDSTSQDFDFEWPECPASIWVNEGPLALVSQLPSRFRGEIWLLNTATAQRQLLPLVTELVTDLSLHPDGRRLLFTAGNPRPDVMMLTGLPWQK